MKIKKGLQIGCLYSKYYVDVYKNL